MDIKNAIYGRRSIRNYTDKVIPEATLKEIIHAGTYAPSACNFQAWKFIIIDESSIKNKIIAGGGSPVINKSPQGILVVYRNDLFVDGKKHKDYIQSAAAAIQNMLLMAYSFDIASCWLCNLPSSKEMRSILGIPNNYDVIAYIVLGYPIEGTGSNNQQMSYHYGNETDFISHKRRFTEEQVICHNQFKSVEGDSTKYIYHKDSLLEIAKKRFKVKLRKLGILPKNKFHTLNL